MLVGHSECQMERLDATCFFKMTCDVSSIIALSTELSVNTVISVNRTDFSFARMCVSRAWEDAERRAAADSDDGLPRALGTQRASNHRGWPRRATARCTCSHLANRPR